MAASKCSGTEPVTGLTRYTWSDYVAQATEGVSTMSMERRSSRKEDRDHSWDLGAGWEGALDMAHQGWKGPELDDAMRLAAQVTARVVTDHLATAFQPTMGFVGRPHVPSVLAGRPRPMIRTEPVKVSRQGRVVRIAVPTCYSAAVPAETVRNRGAAVMALCQALTVAQHPLEVWAVDARAGGSGRSARAICIQEAGASLNMGRLMFALAHPAMLRRLGFSLDECQSSAFRQSRGVPGGYGAPSYDAKASDLPDLRGHSIVLPSLGHGDRWGEEEARTWIEAQVQSVLSDAQ